MPAPKGNKNAVGNKGGAPTKFKPEYTKAMIDFFDIEPYKKETMEQVTEYYQDGTVRRKSEKFKYIPEKFPTILKFAKNIEVAYFTVKRWADKGMHEENDKKPDPELVKFCEAYKQAKVMQKEFLIEIGLSGSAPPASFIFTAKNVTDMKDSRDVTSGGEKISGIVTIEVPPKK